MIDLALKVIDRFISLAKYRSENQRAFFIDHIDPLYKEIETIHKNYTSSFNDFINKVDEIDDKNELIKYVINTKSEYEYLRIKARSYAKIALVDEKNPNSSNEFFRSSARYFIHLSDTAIGEKGLTYYSTILEILSEIYTDEDSQNNKVKLKERLEGIIEQVNECWEDLSQQYCRCRMDMV